MAYSNEMPTYGTATDPASSGTSTPGVTQRKDGFHPFQSMTKPFKGWANLGRFTGKPVKTAKDMLAADLATMQNDPNALGLTDAERRKMVGQATEAANAQQQGQVSQLGQQALAGQGFQAGAFRDAQRDVASQGESAAVRASADVNELHQQMVEENKARIRQDLDAARERAKENTRFWLQFGLQGVEALLEAAGVSGSPLQGLANAAGGFPTQPAAPSSGGGGGGSDSAAVQSFSGSKLGTVE